MRWFLVLAVSAAMAQTPNPQVVDRGARIYSQSCAVGYCHGVAGTTARSPNLRGRPFEREHLYRVVRDGIPFTTMEGWRHRMKADEIDAVVAYLLSLAGAPRQVVSKETALAFNGPKAAGRGYNLFFDPSKPTMCGTCHALGGRGNAVGPDLARLARVSPRGLAIAMLSTRTQYVQQIDMKNGEKFPAMQVAADSDTVQVFDLSKTPPSMRRISRADSTGITDNAIWKHPPESAGYSNQELADIISYIRWACWGDTKGVKPEEIK